MKFDEIDDALESSTAELKAKDDLDALKAKMAAEGKWDELQKWQDELDGGKGDDTLIGHDGDDIYHFNLGEGTDAIEEKVKVVSYSNNDKVVFGDLVNPENVTVSHDGSHLTFSFKMR